MPLGEGGERCYPGTQWCELQLTHEGRAGPCFVRIGRHLHAVGSVPPQVQATGPPPRLMDGTGYRTRLWDIPVEDIVERHYELRGGRSRSVLTFEKKR